MAAQDKSPRDMVGGPDDFKILLNVNHYGEYKPEEIYVHIVDKWIVVAGKRVSIFLLLVSLIDQNVLDRNGNHILEVWLVRNFDTGLIFLMMLTPNDLPLTCLKPAYSLLMLLDLDPIHST